MEIFEFIIKEEKLGQDLLHYCGKRISAVTTRDYLWITFNEHLSFERNINEKVKKAKSLAGMTLVKPLMEYGAAVWNQLQYHLIDITENVQRRTSKLVLGLSRLTCSERSKVFDLQMLQYRRYHVNMIEFYNLFHHCYSCYNEYSSQTRRKSLQR